MPDGDLDLTWGGTGKVVTDLGTNADTAYSIALQADGKVVCFGGTSTLAAVVRYNTDGSLDTGFNTTGKVIVSWAGSFPTYFSGLVQAADQKIVAAGAEDSPNSWIFGRYTTAGAADATWGTAGQFNSQQTPSGSNQTFSIAQQSSGKVVSGGWTNPGTGEIWLLMRCTASGGPADGALDATFGTAGVTTTQWSVNGPDRIDAIAVQSDDKIVAAGFTSDSTLGVKLNMAVARYSANGVLDNTFGTGGKVTVDFHAGNDSQVYGVAVQPDGKIVCVGLTDTQNGAIIRLTPAGILDPAFGTSGKVTFALGGGANVVFYGVALQADGKIIVCGRFGDPLGATNDKFGVARFTTAGILDTTWAGIGYVEVAFSAGTDIAYSVAVQNDGKVIATGVSNTRDFATARFGNAAPSSGGPSGAGPTVGPGPPGRFQSARAMRKQRQAWKDMERKRGGWDE